MKTRLARRPRPLLPSPHSPPGSAAAPAAHAAAIPPPGHHGTLRVSGLSRDGAAVTATGLRWRAPRLPRGMSLLSFGVAYSWQSCDAAGKHCRSGADSTAAPFAARRYTVGHADTGRRLRVTETAAEVVQTQRNPFTFQVIRRSVSALTSAAVRAYPRHRPPATAFVNGTPERRTASAEEYFQVAAPHANAADGTGDPVVPDRRRPLAGHARQPRVLHRHARAWAAPGGRAHRQPGGRHRDHLRLAGRPAARAAALSRPVLVPAAPGPHRPPDALGLADRPDHPAAADRAQRGGHLRHRRLPHHPGAGHRDQDRLAGEHPGPSAHGLLPRPGLGGLPARRDARAGSSRPRAGEHLLRLSRGALGRPAPAGRAEAHAPRARGHVRAEGLRRGRAGRHRQLRPAVDHRLPPHPRRRAELPRATRST